MCGNREEFHFHVDAKRQSEKSKLRRMKEERGLRNAAISWETAPSVTQEPVQARFTM